MNERMNEILYLHNKVEPQSPLVILEVAPRVEIEP
jgi:hypothetical protein